MNSVVSQQSMELKDFLAILRRRKLHFTIPFVFIALAGLALAFGLPPVYRSEATILIEKQNIPDELIQTTVTGYVEERIKSLQERLLTVDSLWRIANTQDLYPGERTRENRKDIITRMRESIFVEMVSVKANDPGSGKQSTATIAFTVAYESGLPQDTKNVTEELSSLFLQENRKARSTQAANVSNFLEMEASRLSKEIEELEVKLALFKQEQKDQLPELWDVNVKLFEKAESNIGTAEQQIRSYQDTINALQAELAITNPYQDLQTAAGQKIQAPAERLKALMAEYLRLSSTYNPNHPDVIKMRGEIKSLESQTGGRASSIHKLFGELTRQQAELMSARQKYSNEHPDVRKLKQSVATLETKLSEMQLSGSQGSTQLAVAPDNPRYVSLKTQLSAAQGNLKAERVKLVQLNQKMTEYERRLFQTPTVERDYKSLARDYENARKKYQELRDKQREARLAEQLEGGSQAEKLIIIQPAFLPVTPDKPNRLGIALLSCFLAFAGGVGSVSVAEYMDHTIRGSRGIIDVFGAPPLVVVPLIRQSRNSGRSRDLAIDKA